MKNYQSIWRHFNKFLINLQGNVKHLSWEERAVLFGTHLVDQGSQSQTIASYFSAIKHILKMDDYIWDNEKAQLSTITRSCRILNDTLKVRLPIQIKLLELILFEVGRHFGRLSQPYLEKLYKLTFALAYYGMMRVGELTTSPHTAKAKDVHIGENKDKILIILHSSKTHGRNSFPQEIKISAGRSILETKVDRFFCPFELAREYCASRGPYLKDDEPFLIFRDRSGMKPSHFQINIETDD